MFRAADSGAGLKRAGKTLKTIPKGDRRRMSDAKNAWRKMTPKQRDEFTEWTNEEQAREEQASRALTHRDERNISASLGRRFRF